MLTYDLTQANGPVYKYIYNCIKEDIEADRLVKNEKMPSKRTLAKNLGVSIITIENAYEQLIDEGYIYAIAKKGYYVSDIASIKKIKVMERQSLHIQLPQREEEVRFDFSSNQTEEGNFPFSVWTRLMRETISLREHELLEVSPCGGVRELREAIAWHLGSFRGMYVDPDQIIVGAGTEYLYGLLIQLLGKNRIYCIENPGYRKLSQIYREHGVRCVLAGLDEKGVNVQAIQRSGAQIAHISPTHHFPTGITMSLERRQELLDWAGMDPHRYIIEDDYDSEFRLKGKPLAPLLSMDTGGKVIYMNTFSKSLTSTIRISYMVLPEALINEFYRRLSFYSCTVSTFEQYTLAAFIGKGYFEKHINRMRLHYGRKRTAVLALIREIFAPYECRIIENDSGLHFIMEFGTSKSDRELEEDLAAKKIKIRAVTDFDMSGSLRDKHQFILNYSNMDADAAREALLLVRSSLFNELDDIL